MREKGQKKGRAFQARSCPLKKYLNFIPVKAPKGGPALRRGEKSGVWNKVFRADENDWTGANRIHLAGLEPATFGSVDRCSIQLSYRCKVLISKDLLTSRAGRVIYG
jgi:hypothetical protein